MENSVLQLTSEDGIVPVCTEQSLHEKELPALGDRQAALSQQDSYRGTYKCVSGKIGEWFEDHRGCLVGGPFPLETCAEAYLVPGQSGISVSPSSYWKTRQLCQAIVRKYNAERVAIHVSISSRLDSGKGCALSTASMRAGGYAVADLLGVLIDHAWLAEKMAEIEPSDANVSDGRVVVWDFRNGRALSPEYPLPYGGYIGGYPLHSSLHTDVVNRQRPDYTSEEKATLDLIFAEAPKVLQAGDINTLALFASQSAEINARYFPKPELAQLRRLYHDRVIQGYWTAHSGVAFGAFVPPDLLKRVFAKLTRSLGAGYQLFAFEHNESTDGLPFLLGCGSSLISTTTTHENGEKR